MSRRRHIFCIEGNWNTNPRSKQSVRPILDILYHSCGVKYIYHKVNTKAEFLEALRQYTFRRYDNYSVLTLEFHGRPGKICIGKEFVGLDEISSVLSGRLTDFVAHLDSCCTLRVQRRVIDDFFANTKASLLTGYRRQVDFIESTAEILSLLYRITQPARKFSKGKLTENLRMIVAHEK